MLLKNNKNNCLLIVVCCQLFLNLKFDFKRALKTPSGGWFYRLMGTTFNTLTRRLTAPTGCLRRRDSGRTGVQQTTNNKQLTTNNEQSTIFHSFKFSLA